MFAKSVYVLSDGDRESLKGWLQTLPVDCLSINLTVSVKVAADLLLMLNHPKSREITNLWASQQIENLASTIRYEMEDHLFLFVPSDRAKWYTTPRDGWEQVTARFPGIELDIEEAARCYACDRYAGAVFHAMLVAERGAIEIGRLIELNDPKPGWPATIREMQHVIHRTKYEDLKPVQQKHRPLLTQILPIMESMQEGWRNKISHVENRLVLMTSEFSPQVAEEILIATRAFMRRLATDLPTVQ